MGCIFLAGFAAFPVISNFTKRCAQSGFVLQEYIHRCGFYVATVIMKCLEKLHSLVS